VECLLVTFVLVALLIAAVAAVAGRHGGEWNDAFKHVARRFHGVLSPGGWFSDPSVWIQHGDARARLTINHLRGSGGERSLQFVIHQREVRCRCEIFYHQTRSSLLPPRRGLAAMEFDWDEFRRRWQVLADDPDEARQLLSDGVRLAIDILWRQPMPAEMTVSISPGCLAVRKVWRSPRGPDIEAFVERVCALSDQLNLASAQGIEFVAGDEPQLLEHARCGVCGDGLASEIVVCRRCNTPHHRECWQYGGGCATYGCGSRECFAPEAPLHLHPHWDASGAASERPLKPR
jgi:hypothetical protein